MSKPVQPAISGMLTIIFGYHPSNIPEEIKPQDYPNYRYSCGYHLNIIPEHTAVLSQKWPLPSGN